MKRVLYILFCLCIFILSVTLIAQPDAEKEKTAGDSRQPVYSFNQQELGMVVLKGLEIRGGKLIFLAATGGCTKKNSFKIDVVKESGFQEQTPHYIITIRRVVPDDCKAFFPDGISIEIDLVQDLGLGGSCTVSVANPVQPGSPSFD
ncbi:MAG: hypothetical protein JW969_18005 [Spirochaetales bacterium]|nr:hypothetical protein [Spirochaetales bacterium]